MFKPTISEETLEQQVVQQMLDEGLDPNSDTDVKTFWHERLM